MRQVQPGFLDTLSALPGHFLGSPQRKPSTSPYHPASHSHPGRWAPVTRMHGRARETSECQGARTCPCLPTIPQGCGCRWAPFSSCGTGSALQGLEEAVSPFSGDTYPCTNMPFVQALGGLPKAHSGSEIWYPCACWPNPSCSYELWFQSHPYMPCLRGASGHS